MNLDYDFVQVWKFSEDQKKMQMEHFFPQIQVKTKKKVFITNGTLFSPIFAQKYCTPIQIIGGDTAKLLRGYIPAIPPCFGTPGGLHFFY